VARPPAEFSGAKLTSCARITTRVLCQCDSGRASLSNYGVTDPMDDIQPVTVGGRNYVLRIARGVLVRTSEDNNMPTMGGQETAGMATVWSDSDDSYNVDEDDQVNGGNSNCNMKEEKKVYEPYGGNTTSGVAERAYWVRQVLCAAIYMVMSAMALYYKSLIHPYRLCIPVLNNSLLSNGRKPPWLRPLK